MNVLVVDDDEAVAGFCCAVLSEAGHTVIEAHSGNDALAILAERDVDLVLADVHMPSMSGLDLLKAITAAANHPEVVLLTGYGTVSSAVEAMRCGAFDYILKPIAPNELGAVVERVKQARAERAESRLLPLGLTPDWQKEGLVGAAPCLLDVFASILRIASRRHPVLITGETGTGKELVARAIHRRGRNPEAPFVAVDCGALPPGLVESELFGHVRGAFTGAALGRPGLLASAGCGTLFLDEVGELSSDIQSRLFRLIQEGEFRQLGSDSVRKFEARVIAATDRNLEDGIERGTFRPELYYRLNVHHIYVPPLRSRKGDIPILIRHFLAKHGDGRNVSLAADAMALLSSYHWPGNVRELENCILHLLAESDAAIVERRDLPRAIREAIQKERQRESPLDESERATIAAMLETCRGNVTEASRRLRVSKATLYRKMERYGLTPERQK
jgi:two-component system response regulator HydG